MFIRISANSIRSALVLAAVLSRCANPAFAQSPAATDAVQPPATGAAVTGSAPVTTPSRSSTENFFTRLAKAYAEDWKELSSSDAGPASRGTPSPVEGPPFPFSDWPSGGSVVIG